MYDFEEKVKQFLKENFTHAQGEANSLNFSNAQLLDFLFDVFPKDCITDFQLYDILLNLGYEKKVVDITNNQTKLVWSLKTKTAKN